jgi:hypothetical protein
VPGALCGSCKTALNAAAISRNISAPICDACLAVLSQGTDRAKCREILRAIDAPVLLMQPEPRQVFTANDAALALFGRHLSEAEGHRGGDVFGCVHSFTEAGCGRDVNCDDCRIKAAIVGAFSGVTLADASTTLSIRRGSDTPYAIAVSTEQVGG